MSTEEDDDLAKRQRNAVYDAEDAAEEARSAPEGETVLPEMDSGDDDKPDAISGGDTDTPDTTTAADYPSEATRSPQPAAPQPVEPPKPDTTKSDIAAALRGIGGKKHTPPASLSDDAIEAARQKRQQQIHGNDLSRAISSWLMRKPFEPTPPEDEAASMLQRRGADEARFRGDRASELSAAALAAKALKGEKVPGGSKYDDPYHTALGNQANSLVDERKRKAAAEDEKRTREAGELDALRREAGKQLPGVDVNGLGAIDLRALIHAKDAKERARILAAAQAKKAEEGRPLAPTALSELADADVAKKQVEKLAKTFSELGMGSPTAKASAFFTKLLGLQFTDAAQFEAEAGRVRQAAGKILEGGKLAEGDERKYARLMLQPGDSDEVIAVKTAGMVDFLEDIKAGRIKVYRSGGYKVPADLDTPKPSPAPDAEPIVNLVAKDGRKKRVKRSVAEQFIKDYPGEATIQ